MTNVLKVSLDDHLTNALTRAEEVEFSQLNLETVLGYIVTRVYNQDDDLDTNGLGVITDVMYYLTDHVRDDPLKHLLMSLLGRLVLELSMSYGDITATGFVSDFKLVRVGNDFLEVAYVHDPFDPQPGSV